jgi:UDP-N-acetyl-D-mannosaminuronic acid dehydrogenase
LSEICILGLGYIGLPTALLFASKGKKVIGVDINPKVVDSLNKGILHFEEKGLQELFDKARKLKTFEATSDMKNADVYIICAPTPLNKHYNMADLDYVEKGCRMILPFLKKKDLVIIESTISPGSSETLFAKILEQSGLKAGKDFYLVHCPERAIPGNTIYEMINNYRIIGGISKKGAQKAKAIYATFVAEEKMLLTDVRTAEIVKLMENTFRDINIALANEFALISEDLGINVWEAIKLANLHPRVDILKPGPGVGGHCIAIDPWFLTETTLNTQLIRMARGINDNMPNYTFQMMKQLLDEKIVFPTITILGVAYKENVDDTRETPAEKFIFLARNQGMKIKVFDPHCKDYQINNEKYGEETLEEAVKDSDCIVLITGHDEFKQIDPQKIGPLMKQKNLLDARNALDHKKWTSAGFKVKVLGYKAK